MNKKNILFTILGAVLLTVIVLAAKFISDAPYRSQLPALPDLNTITKPLADQLTAAQKMASLFTTAHTLGALGMAYHSSADNVRAVHCYNLAIKKNSSDWKWNYYLGCIYLDQGQSENALKNFEQVIDKDPENYLAVYHVAEAYQSIGASDKAKQFFQQVISANSQSSAKTTQERDNFFPLPTYAKFQLARLYTGAGKADSAATLLKEITIDQPGFGPAFRSLSVLYSASGDSVLANKYSIRSDDLLAYAPPADSMIDQLALISRSEDYLLKQIEDALHSNNDRWALLLCNHALTYFPENKILISTAVFENLKQGYDDKALGYLDKHFNYYSNDAKELMDATDLLYNRKHLAEAIRYFNQVKTLMPQNSALATWLFDRGKKNEAVAMMNTLLKQYPNDTKILSDDVRLLLQLEDDETAGKYLALLEQHKPSGAEILQLKGLVAEKRNDTAAARLNYEAAYTIDPTDLIFTRSLIDFFIRQKNWATAFAYFRRAIDRFPNEPFLLEGLGRLLIACPDTALRDPMAGLEYAERAFYNYRSPTETRLSAGKLLATEYLALRDKKRTTNYINQTIRIAEQSKQSKEYVAYFRALIAK